MYLVKKHFINELPLLGSSRKQKFINDAKKVDMTPFLGGTRATSSMFGPDLPKYLKYKEKYLTTADGQGKCASCFSIVTAHLLADRISIMTGGNILRPLSIQELISCWKVHGDRGCLEGGQPEEAYSYIEKNGLATKKDYEYRQKDTTRVFKCEKKKLNGFRTYVQKGSVKILCSDPRRYSPDSRRYIKTVESNIKNMKKELFLNGPFMCMIAVHDNLYNYNGLSVYRGDEGTKLHGYHAILITGYAECGVNKDEPNFNYPYWIAKNSWSSEWSPHLKGYFYVEMGKNVCDIESRASSALPVITDEIRSNIKSIEESRYITYDDYVNDPEREQYIKTVGSILR